MKNIKTFAVIFPVIALSTVLMAGCVPSATYEEVRADATNLDVAKATCKEHATVPSDKYKQLGCTSPSENVPCWAAAHEMQHGKFLIEKYRGCMAKHGWVCKENC